MNESVDHYAREWTVAPSQTLQDLWPRAVRGEVVVELGAATGRNAVLLAPEVAYIGLEVDPDLIRLGVAGGRDIRACDLTSESSLSSHQEALRSAQTVLLLDVLEHLPAPESLLQFLDSVLSSECRVLMSVPNIGFLPARLELLRGRFPRNATGIFDRTHLHFYDRAAVESDLAKSMTSRRCLVYPTAKAVRGGRISRLPAGGRLTEVARKGAAVASRLRPGLFAYEWLLIAYEAEYLRPCR